MNLTEDKGAEVIIDFVGSQETLAFAAKISRPKGRIILVGMEGGGTYRLGGAPLQVDVNL